jgi:adenylate kinase
MLNDKPSKPALVLMVFGPQGSGKSTQGEFLAHHFSLPYFDAGAALRDLAKSDSDLGRSVQADMHAGRLVSNNTLKQLFLTFMQENDWHRGFITDGFPRNTTQVELLRELADEYDWQIQGLYYHISDRTAEQRLALRHTIIDGQAVKRDDDQPAIVAKRLATFKIETVPVIDWLKKHHQLIEIDGEPTAEEVSRLSVAAVTPLFNV